MLEYNKKTPFCQRNIFGPLAKPANKELQLQNDLHERENE